MNLVIKRKYFLALCLLPAVAIADEQTFKIHIFDDSSVEVKKEVAQEQELQMIIFDEPVSGGKEKQAVKETEAFNYWEIGLSTGYQNESLAWQVASPIINESWNSVDLWNLQADLKFKLPSGFLLKGRAKYGFLFDGNFQANDEFGRSIQSVANDGSAMEFSGAGGYEFILGKKNQAVWGSITPLVGYEYQEQDYKAINNSYNTQWKGPWVGLDMVLGLQGGHEFFMNSAVHWADFEAEGTKSIYSLEHSAKSHGYKAGMGYRFRANDSWALNLSFEYQHWDTKVGNETLILQSGDVIGSELTSVLRSAFSVNTGVEFSF
mgnify:CR=1 FL=1